MARYQIILTYDGTHFVGSQRQGSSSRTVQGELEKALRKLDWRGKSILLAGRTDTGVHASGQVAAFDLEWTHPLEKLVKALNAGLPLDMAVSEVHQAPGDFHPRFDAVSRRYRYRLFCQEKRNPLRERYAWRVWPPVTDLTPLASIWLGVHDFSAFGTPPRRDGNTVRRVMETHWRQLGDEWIFEIQADAFLYRMVRRLVFVQVAAGQGRFEVESLRQALDPSPGQQGSRCGKGCGVPAGLAPAHGLMLVEVKY